MSLLWTGGTSVVETVTLLDTRYISDSGRDFIGHAVYQ